MLDWEENLFLGLRALHRRLFVRPEERRRESVRRTLRERRGSLLPLATLVAGRPVELFETSETALGSGTRIFLPPEYSIAATPPGNDLLFDLRTILAALRVRATDTSAFVSAQNLAETFRGEFPGLEPLLQKAAGSLPPGVDFWNLFGPALRGPEACPTPVPHPEAPPPAETPAESATELEGSGQTDVEVTVSQGDDGPGADLPTHTFEKVETLEESGADSRKSDEEDELEEHEEALRELKMRRVLRSPGRPHSIYRSDVILDGLTVEVADRMGSEGIPYPEWDHRRGEFRPNWCWIQETEPAGGLTEWVRETAARHHRLIRRLKRQFAALTSDWRHRPRQPVGVEFDLDAVVQFETDRRTRRTPSESIHLDRRPEPHDLAVVILLDVSYSTDAWIDNRRVLDVIRESVFCAGEALEDVVPNLALAAFSSNTRRSCRFQWVKRFGAPWTTSRSGLGALEPSGYTRIGPALRHAQEQLRSTTASRKLVLLMTDGRPCDYDQYEGVYGIRDVRKAIESGRCQGIQTHAFAVEKRAAEFLPRIFRPNHFDIIPRADRLADTLCRLFARMLRR
ncbi:MAG: VWA domain-containing protein [Verrucomicrobiales bacterium]|nr:VWA domain-containing protein [Verrucomicrobiales bacterium]